MAMWGDIVPFDEDQRTLMREHQDYVKRKLRSINAKMPGILDKDDFRDLLVDTLVKAADESKKTGKDFRVIAARIASCRWRNLVSQKLNRKSIKANAFEIPPTSNYQGNNRDKLISALSAKSALYLAGQSNTTIQSKDPCEQFIEKKRVELIQRSLDALERKLGKKHREAFELRKLGYYQKEICAIYIWYRQ